VRVGGFIFIFIFNGKHWLLIAFHKIGRRTGTRILYSNFFYITEVLKYGFLVASFFIGDSLLVRVAFTCVDTSLNEL
jgi:hypothetical protein